jgi:serine protease Do
VRGEVIGINTAIQTRMGTFNGIGYAIPINDARRVADLLIEHGRIIRSYLGIVMEPMDPDLAATFGLSESKGVLVAEVLEDSPAGDAGLRHGDVILAFNDEPIESQAHVQNLVAYMPPGTKVKLRIWRDKQEKNVRVTLREQPSNFSTRQIRQLTPPEQTSKSDEDAERSFSWKDAGLTIYPLNSRWAKQYNWPRNREGLVVTAVNPDGPAARAGISEGDILLEIDGVALETLDDLEKAADSASMSKGIRLYFETHFGKRYFLLRQDR